MAKFKIQRKEEIIIFLILIFLSGFLFMKCEGITDEITEDLTSDIVETAKVGLDAILLNIPKLFNPSLNLFYRASSYGEIGFFEGADTSTGTDYYVGDNEMIGMFRSYSQYVGITIASTLAIWVILMYFFSGIFTESKNNPIRCVACYLLALLMIYYAQDIMNYFLEIAQIVWERAISTKGTYETPPLEKFWLMKSNDAELIIMGAKFVGGPVINGILSILGLYFTWQLVKGFLRLWLEMAERYLVVCIMVFFFPVICPFIISKETAVIIKSFMRMLIGQLFLLISGFIFMKGFFILLNTGNQSTPIGYVFVMAYLRTAQRLDSYMASMGLNVAQTGSGLFDSFAVAAHCIGATMRGANEVRKGTAGAMKASAIGSGNKGMFKMASAIGFNMRDAARAGSVGGIKNIGGELDYLMSCGKAGQKVSAGTVTDETAQKVVSGFMKNPSFDNRYTVYALPEESLKKALESSGAIPQGIKLNSAVITPQGTILTEGRSESGQLMKGTVSSNVLNQKSIKTGNEQEPSYYTPSKTTQRGEVLPIDGKSSLNDALMACGHPQVENDIKTMDDYHAAVESNDKKMQDMLKRGGMTEALYEAPFGTQCVTGENCEYGSGMATACIFPDGNYMEYSRAADDMEVTANRSLDDEQKSKQLFGRTFTDVNHEYDPYEDPDLVGALNSLSSSEKESLGYQDGMDLEEANGGFGIHAEFERSIDGESSYLKVNYGDYDFDKNQLNSLYPDYKIQDGATPQRGGYGQQMIDVYNTQTGESAKMMMNNVAVYGYGRTGDRVIVGNKGDSYSTSIVSKEVNRNDNRSKLEKPLNGKEKKVDNRRHGRKGRG